MAAATLRYAAGVGSVRRCTRAHRPHRSQRSRFYQIRDRPDFGDATAEFSGVVSVRLDAGVRPVLPDQRAI